MDWFVVYHHFNFTELCSSAYFYEDNGMKWFRLWTDILDDVKILQLTDYEYRIFTYLLAHASEVDSMSGELQSTFKSLSIRFRQRFNHFSRAIETFQRLGFVSINEQGFIVITNWNKRQFKSDNSYERVKKYRQVNSKRNVTVTELKRPQIQITDTDKEKILKKKAFQKPTLDQVKTYCYERGNEVHPEVWFDHYESNGWLVGKNPMKDWQAAVRTWEKNHGNNGNGNGQNRFQRNHAPVSREAGSQRSDDPEVEKIKALFRQKANDNRKTSFFAADGNAGDVPDFNP
jgi:hypothetical protein